MNKKIITTVLVLGLVVLAGGFLATRAKANSGFGLGDRAQVLAEKLGVDQEEVSGAFQEMREERRQKMREMAEERLNQAVEDGVLTEDQKQALLDKKAEMQNQREQHKAEMQSWFEENGIDHNQLREYLGGFGRGKRFGGCLGE